MTAPTFPSPSRIPAASRAVAHIPAARREAAEAHFADAWVSFENARDALGSRGAASALLNGADFLKLGLPTLREARLAPGNDLLSAVVNAERGARSLGSRAIGIAGGANLTQHAADVKRYADTALRAASVFAPPRHLV